MTAAGLLRRLVPDGLKRRHERWSTARFVRRLSAASSAYLERNELTVVRGPFAGLEYPPELATGAGDLVAKLAGTYELELHGALSTLLDREWTCVVNVGAAEGYYAVGLARALPGARVLAYDIDDDQRARCGHLAVANGVADRVELREQCTPEELQGLPPAGTLVVCDCEGCEARLLDPARAPVLRRWEVLVELHDFVDPKITETLRARFEPTHTVTLIDSTSRADVVPPEFVELPRRERLTLIGERRPADMRWAWMHPRDGAA